VSVRAFGCLFFSALLTVIALSTGGRMYLLVALLLAALFALALISALWAKLTFAASIELNERAVSRGDALTLKLRTRNMSPLPIAPLLIKVRAPESSETLRVSTPALRTFPTLVRIRCPHVGRFEIGLTDVRIEDVFGLFSFFARRGDWTAEALVLPRTEEVSPLRFSPGESELEFVSRATEDVSSPSDVRAYLPGDELKKIHWKLSLRRREILVRTYDQPLRPEALILLDCAPPPPSAHSWDVRDRLCDIAASICKSMLETGADVHMPLAGEPPESVSLRRGDPLAPAMAAIARMGFTGKTRFDRVLLLESQRMRRSGSTVVLTGALTPSGADRIARLRRLGPIVRVYLVVDIIDEAQRQLVHQLTQSDVECVVEQLSSERTDMVGKENV
jgi:uncharacterized protein (DUF58 family)